MVWACFNIGREWLGEKIQRLWSGRCKTKGRPKKTWSDFVGKDCQIWQVNEDAVVCSKWKKLTNDAGIERYICKDGKWDDGYFSGTGSLGLSWIKGHCWVVVVVVVIVHLIDFYLCSAATVFQKRLLKGASQIIHCILYIRWAVHQVCMMVHLELLLLIIYTVSVRSDIIIHM